MSTMHRKRRIASAVAALAFALAACTSVPMPHMGTGAPTIGPVGATTLKSAPVKGAAARFAFVKVSGPPPDILQSLNASLNSEARARKLNIVGQDDPDATYQVKGYLSAVGDRQGTVLVYVWDVLDRKGVRLHRVSGQETGAGTSSDPWAGIKRDTVNATARQTIDDLVAWVGAG